MKIKEPIEKFLTGMPKKYEVATGDLLFQALFVDLEDKKIERLRLIQKV